MHNALASDPSQGKRKRTRYATPLKPTLAIYDWVVIVLLLAVPCVGMVWFGSTRIWIFGPLMTLTFLASSLFWLRPVISQHHRYLHVPPCGLLALGFMVYSAGLMPMASVPYEAKIELLRWTSYIAAFWIWTDLATRFKRWRIPLAVLILLVSVIGWYAIIQHCQESRMVLTVERPEIYGMRASGTFKCPNHFASLVEIVMCFALALLLLRDSGGVLRIIGGYALLVLAPVMYLTQSRSGWIGTVVGITVTTVLIAARKSAKRATIAAVALFVLFSALGASLWYLSPTVKERVHGAMLSSPDPAVSARFLMWGDTMDMIADKPLLGHGPGSYRWIYPRYKSHDMEFWIRYAHNEVLHALAEYGAIGFLFMSAIGLGFLFFLTRLVMKGRRDKDAYLAAAMVGAMAASLAHSCFDFNFHLFSNMHVLVMLAGLVAAGAFASAERSARALTRPKSITLSTVAVIISLLFAGLSAQATLTNAHYRKGESARESFKMDEARVAYQRASAIDRDNWQPYLGIGDTYQAQSFWNFNEDAKKEQALQAINNYDLALARNPHDVKIWFGLQKANRSLGNDAQALVILEHITTTWRNYPFYLAHYGSLLRKMGQLEEARGILIQARDIKPGDKMIQLQLRSVEKELGLAP